MTAPHDAPTATGLRQHLGVFLIPLAALVAAALGLLALTAWLEEGRLDFSTASAVGAIGDAAEVVAAVLGIAITVVAIVVELAANRYTHRITELFVREPVNGISMGFLVLTTLYCVWLSATLGGAGGEAVPRGAVGVALAMVTLSLLLLLPYFAFVFAFLQPLSIVDRIRADAFRVVRRAARGYRHGLRMKMVRSLEQLEDVALNAMDHKDQSISLAAVEALRRFLLDYGQVRDALDPRWFEIDRSLAGDPSFIAMTSQVREDVARQHLWVEMKVMRQYHTLYVDALNRMRGIAYLVALNTHRIATTALATDHLGLFDLAVRIFNSYLRAGINVRDVRSTYYTLHHYRELAEEVMRAGEIERLVDMGSYFRYYGQLAFGEHLPFLLEAVAYDMYMLTEQAFVNESPAREALLEIFLTVDKESESKEQETSLRGVRRAQVQLATYFLEKGDLAHARVVYEDMENERPERLASIRDELLAEESPDYWEVTDRGVNFAYLPPERRARVLEFFQWFGSRVPAPRQAEDGRGPGATHPHTGAPVLREVGEAGSRGFRAG